MKLSDLRYDLISYATKGLKGQRNRKIDKANTFIKFCQGKGVRGADQIGKRHVYEFYETLNASRTRDDYYYAIELIWDILGRGCPPRPRLTEQKRS
jgi:hypothetical protein